MNTEGLFSDGFATAPHPVEDHAGKETFGGNLIEHAMLTCGTVAEVVELFSRHDLRFLENAMTMFADRTGDSVIIEGDELLRIEGRYQITTNFYQSATSPETYACGRWKIARRMLEESEEVSVDLCRRVLAATHVEEQAQTLYSNVYDLQRGLVYLYHFHDFENVVVLDLAEELEKGARVIDLPSLFPETFAYQPGLEKKEREIEEERRRRRAEGIDPAVLDQLVGRYELALPGDRTDTLSVRREGERLLILGEDGEEVEILPESELLWFHVGPGGSYDCEFHRDAEGGVTGLTLEFLGARYEGRRID